MINGERILDEAHLKQLSYEGDHLDDGHDGGDDDDDDRDRDDDDDGGGRVLVG